MRRVVLVRPGGPRNVGMIVRAAANFGPCELVLVAPQRPSMFVHPDFEQMSHGVERAAERCTVVATLDEALADTTHSVGFTARPQEGRVRATWHERREELASLSAGPDERVAFVFGAEVGGLRSAEVEQLAELVWIPTGSDHTSLNLAIAVGIVLAELFHERPHRPRERGVKPLAHAARAYLKANLAHVFGGSVARTDAARRDILESIERVFSRAPLEDRDARAWHLMLRALGSTLTPKDLGLELSPKRARRSALLSAALAKPRVLFVSTDAGYHDRLRSMVAQRGGAVSSARDREELERELDAFDPHLVVLDAALAEDARAELASACAARAADREVLVAAAWADLEPRWERLVAQPEL